MPRHRASAVLLKGDSILMVRISDRGRSWWCLPGGTIEPTETPEETAVRELREELNLRVMCRERLYEAHLPHEDGGDVGILVDALTDPLLPGADPSVTAWAWRSFDDAEDSWQIAEVRTALGHRKAQPCRRQVCSKGDGEYTLLRSDEWETNL